jgi:D-alanine-D-alanine ligase
MPNIKKTIAVIFGGRSVEHDISIITAHVPIIKSLIAIGNFNIVPIYISKWGLWYWEDAMLDIAYFKQPDFENQLRNKKGLQLSFDNGFTISRPGFIPKIIRPDIVFPAMHGTFGEDGSLMGLLRMANVPFVGCDLQSSAVAMDKVFTKQVISAEGVPVVPYVWFLRRDWEDEKSAIKSKVAKLKWPVFVKPAHLGSSIAIAKVNNETELEHAIEVALHYDDKVLVEESVENLIEVTLPIMGNDELRLGAVERPLGKTAFFDFSDKYLSEKKQVASANSAYSEIPANIASNLSREVQDLGKRVYKILGCSGIARVDFLIEGARNQVFVNEVNTMPGSLYQHNWKKIGVSNTELVETLISLAQERFEKEQKITRTFKSDALHKGG